VFSRDPYIDYCIIEAIAMRVAEEEHQAQKRAEREAWKRRPVGSR
jgi:hypothetical protein